jgi:hypothetical protein
MKPKLRVQMAKIEGIIVPFNKRGVKMDEAEAYWFFIECDDDKMQEFKGK